MYSFDVLELDGRDLRAKSWINQLRRILPNAGLTGTLAGHLRFARSSSVTGGAVAAGRAKAAAPPPSVASHPVTRGLERRFNGICDELVPGLTRMDIT
jgi:hypothetical protein